MSGRFVRASKYRHVFGRGTRKEDCYDNLRVSNNAWDTNLVKVNPHYLSVNWETGGGGAFAVIPLNETGRLPERIPLFRGHTAGVLDTDWNPWNDALLASASDDAKVFLWRVPEGFTLRTNVDDPDKVQDIAPVMKLPGHSRKVGHVLFNPAAENVLASSSGDFSVKVWDIVAAAPKLTMRVGDNIQSMTWSANGSLLFTTSRDKKIRLWDPRQQRAAYEGPGHGGAKNQRSVWLGDHARVVTTGFSRMSDRQLALWDTRDLSQPVNGFRTLDSISGVCIPFWDDGTQCLYLAGKGDGNIRYFEYDHDKFEYLSEYTSLNPQRGIGFMPKRGVNMHENEVMRGYKTINDSIIEPISFIVPRRSEAFQEDIFPPTTGLRPAMTSADWFDGKVGIPPKVDMASLYEGEGLKELSPEAAQAIEAAHRPHEPAKQPPPQSQPKPAPAPAPEPETPPVEHVERAEPASIKDQAASVSNMVSKYADKDEPQSDDDASSFEEVPKPVARTPTIIFSPADETAAKQPKEADKPVEKPAEKPAEKSKECTSSPPSSSLPSGAASPTGSQPAASADDLATIKEMIQQQAHTISSQSAKIDVLVGEVEQLKTKLS